VELAVVPTISDFEGFIDYGDDISNRIDSLTSGFLLIEGTRFTQANDILQPIFRTQSANTAVTIYDGSTVVIGGVVEERSIHMDDKVPTVGDIPLIGRGFQSQVRQSRKRCVMFFVTVDIIDASGQKVNQAAVAPVVEGAQ
jgi:general secretion pathway protein D